MFQLEKLKKLSIQIGITGGLLTFILINTIPYLINKRLKESEEYQQAMKMIEAHPEALKYLGEPIEAGSVRVTNKEMYGNDKEKSWFNVPVKGPKTTGNVYCESKILKQEHNNFTVPNPSRNTLQLSKVELTIQNLPGYKLLIKRSE